MRPFPARLAFALGFLSRLPMPASAFAGAADRKLADAADLFALAGVVIALPAGLLLLLSGLWLPAPVAALLALTALVVTTGALHEDGVADSADGFFAHGDVSRRLEIMKDSRIGVFGALALILQFALGWSSLAHIAAQSPLAAACALLAASALSRAGLVWHWHVLPFVRPAGLSESQGRPEWRSVLACALWAGGLSAILLAPPFGPAGLAAAVLAAMLAAFAVMVVSRAKIGGQTGDTLGLSQKCAEVFVLAALAAIAA